MERIFQKRSKSCPEDISGIFLNHLLLTVAEETGMDYSADTALCMGLEKHLDSLIKNAFVPYQLPSDELKQIAQDHPDPYRAIQKFLSSILFEEQTKRSYRNSKKQLSCNPSGE